MQSTVVARTSAGVCVDGKNGNVKIARSLHAMNAGGVAGNWMKRGSPIFNEWKEIAIDEDQNDFLCSGSIGFLFRTMDRGFKCFRRRGQSM